MDETVSHKNAIGLDITVNFARIKLSVCVLFIVQFIAEKNLTGQNRFLKKKSFNPIKSNSKFFCSFYVIL